MTITYNFIFLLLYRNDKQNVFFRKYSFCMYFTVNLVLNQKFEAQCLILTLIQGYVVYFRRLILHPYLCHVSCVIEYLREISVLNINWKLKSAHTNYIVSIIHAKRNVLIYWLKTTIQKLRLGRQWSRYHWNSIKIS